MDRKKLKLVARLAEFGEAGEREAAQYILYENGVTAKELLEESVDDDDMVFVEIPYKTVEERNIIIQNYSRILNTDEVYSWKNRRSITFECPASKAEELRETSERLKIQWREDLKAFYLAFIQKNRLFSDLPCTGPSGLSPEQVDEILRMAKALKQVHLGKLLEA